MSRAWAYLIGGILMGFGFLFFTVWSASIEDSRTLAAILFACASAVIVTREAANRRKRPCPERAQAGRPRD